MYICLEAGTFVQIFAIRYLLFLLHELTSYFSMPRGCNVFVCCFSKPRGCNVCAHIFLSLEAAMFVCCLEAATCLYVV